jgi:RimJ/RimL family protein N-acetyltransferase
LCIANQRGAERAGTVREGILRKRLSINGVRHDAILFSLVAEDLS